MVLGIYSNRVISQLKKPNLLLKSLLLKTKTKNVSVIVDSAMSDLVNSFTTLYKKLG